MNELTEGITEAGEKDGDAMEASCRLGQKMRYTSDASPPRPSSRRASRTTARRASADGSKETTPRAAGPGLQCTARSRRPAPLD